MQFRATTIPQVSGVRPAQRLPPSDRGCPLDTAGARCFWGPSDLSLVDHGRLQGSGAVGDQQDPEPVVAEVAEAVGDAAGLLDQSVDRFRAAVGDAVGGEVGQERLAPLLECSSEAGDLGDRAAGERVDDRQCDLPTLGERFGGEGRAELLVAAPGDGNLEVRSPACSPASIRSICRVLSLSVRARRALRIR